MANKILYGIAILGWMLIIFSLSARNSVESTGDSRGFATNVVTVCASFANRLGIIKEMPSDSEIASFVRKIDHPIRKCAHATIYFVLALLVLLALETNADNFVRNAIVAVIICFLYAMTDEYHQTFVPGRSGELKDCLIDSMGAGLACCFYGIGAIVAKRRKEK
ncbi:MAG: VanZ family protein [Clostridia bacterium]|nr:VanZ family protein [Clostridia bacterium]